MVRLGVEREGQALSHSTYLRHEIHLSSGLGLRRCRKSDLHINTLNATILVLDTCYVSRGNENGDTKFIS